MLHINDFTVYDFFSVRFAAGIYRERALSSRREHQHAAISRQCQMRASQIYV